MSRPSRICTKRAKVVSVTTVEWPHDNKWYSSYVTAADRQGSYLLDLGKPHKTEIRNYSYSAQISVPRTSMTSATVTFGINPFIQSTCASVVSLPSSPLFSTRLWLGQTTSVAGQPVATATTSGLSTRGGGRRGDRRCSRSGPASASYRLSAIAPNGNHHDCPARGDSILTTPPTATCPAECGSHSKRALASLYSLSTKHWSVSL